jgi:hypothetical protein
MTHGQQRARQKAYSLKAVLIEYRLLGRILLTALRQAGRPDLQTEDLIHDAIHRGIANAASEFTRIRSEAEREHLAERERALQELQATRSLLEAILTHLPVGVSITDARKKSGRGTSRELREVAGRA